MSARVLCRVLFALCGIAALSFASPFAQAQNLVDPPAKIQIEARRIEHFDARDPALKIFGALEFRGGLELTSSYKEFGGLSAIRLSADGTRFLAASDKARWFRGRILYRNGAPQSLVDVETAYMLGADGRPLEWRGWYDTESIAEDGGTIYVGIERVHRIVRFDYGKDGLLARGQPIAVPVEFKSLPRNKGIECLAIPAKGQPLAGTLIAISERGLDDAGNILGFLIGGAAPGKFTVKRLDGFDVSDCAVSPGAELFVLERRASWTRGLATRIRRISLSKIKPGAAVDGPILMEADLGFNIDNMEGLSVHRGPSGEIVLTLVSDDNFSALQRTVLLQFVTLDR